MPKFISDDNYFHTTYSKTTVPRVIVDSYSTLLWVTWEAVTVVEVQPNGGCYDTRWLTGLWSTQAKVEGIVLKAAWHCSRDSGVVNDPLEEPGRTPLCRTSVCVGLRGR